MIEDLISDEEIFQASVLGFAPKDSMRRIAERILRSQNFEILVDEVFKKFEHCHPQVLHILCWILMQKGDDRLKNFLFHSGTVKKYVDTHHDWLHEGIMKGRKYDYDS